MLIPGSTTHASTTIPIAMTFFINNLILYLYGQNVNNEKRQQNPVEFIETLFFTIDSQLYIDKAKKQMTIYVIF